MIVIDGWHQLSLQQKIREVKDKASTSINLSSDAATLFELLADITEDLIDQNAELRRKLDGLS